MASNDVVKTDAAGNTKAAKPTSCEKLDGIVVAIMAMGPVMAREAPQASVYEERGVIVL